MSSNPAGAGGQSPERREEKPPQELGVCSLTQAPCVLLAVPGDTGVSQLLPPEQPPEQSLCRSHGHLQLCFKLLEFSLDVCKFLSPLSEFHRIMALIVTEEQIFHLFPEGKEL